MGTPLAWLNTTTVFMASDLVYHRGDERTRTADPLLAKQVLYQLSYVPRAMVPAPGASSLPDNPTSSPCARPHRSRP